MATTKFSDFDDDDTFNDIYEADGRTIRDGKGVRVPVSLMDSVQRAVAASGLRVTDGLGNGGLAMNKPGFRVARETGTGDMHDAAAHLARRRIADAYRDYETYLTSAYLNPEFQFCEDEAVDSVRVPAVHGGDHGTVIDAMQRRALMRDVYAEYDLEISNVWKDQL